MEVNEKPVVNTTGFAVFKESGVTILPLLDVERVRLSCRMSQKR
jgi:hypothetical protein